MTERSDVLLRDGGMVFRKGGGTIGIVARWVDGWAWRTATMEHSGVASSQRQAIKELIAAWDAEGAP